VFLAKGNAEAQLLMSGFISIFKQSGSLR
jgi:hypothetical protein